MSEIFNMVGDGTSIVNFCQRPPVAIWYPENMKLMNGKQKVLFSGKQLKDNA